MALKMTGTLKFIVLCIITELVWGQSLTIVLDTTMSMQEDIDVIKSNLRSVVDAVRLEPHVNEFILVPFSDPNVGDPVTTTFPEAFLQAVNGIRTSGGTDCPENSLAGIRKALEVSRPESSIYVFTDAFAKDYNHVSAVKDLCRTTKSKVVIFLSGYCMTREGTTDIYKNITQHCSGAVFQLGPSNFRKAFQFMKEMITVEWNNIQSFAPIADRFEFEVSFFHSNSFSSNMLIVATGRRPSVEVRDCEECEEVMRDSKSFHVLRVKPHVGTYRATLRCETCSSLVIYERLSLQFEYGFSPRPVKNIKETSLKPIPGVQNYITIFLTNLEGVSVTSIELQSGCQVSQLQVEEVAERPGCFSASEYIDAQKRYRLVIQGYDSSTSQRLTGSTKFLEPQKSGFAPASMAPILEIVEPEHTLVEFGASVTVPCRVTAYPKPDIWWEDGDENRFNSENVLLETPAVYMSYVTIDDFATNITLHCKAKNWDGEATQELNLFVNRTAVLEFVQMPRDESFKYGSRGQLTCEVDSYPEATIKWYHNETELDNSDNISIDEDEVVINQMRLEDAGEYKCEATNTIETKSASAFVSVSGLEYPELATDENMISISPDTSTCIECRIVNGYPNPDVSWLYKANDEDEFGDVPSESYTSEGPSLCTMAAGTYKCTGSNILGEDSKEVIVKIKSPPKIRNSDDDTVTVKKRSRIDLPCEVESASTTTVRWEISQGDVRVPLTGRHHIDNKNTLRFTALWKDSGTYRCIAENEFGTAEKTYNVVVLVDPYIQAPSPKTVRASVGTTVTLTCNVLYGNPPPSTRWEFYTTNSPPTTILREDPTHTELTLENITKSQEGTYSCIANNTVGVDSITIVLNVH